MNVLAIVKDTERYVFLYDDDESRSEFLVQLAKAAADPSLSLTWYDAAVLTLRARGLAPLKRPLSGR